MQFTKNFFHLILNSLYFEYCDLSFKLQKIRDLISAYGGQVPSESTPTTSTECSPSGVTISTITTSGNQDKATTEHVYPLKGSWRDKIIFGLKSFGTAVTAKELSNYILHAEQSDDLKYIDATTAQYLSFLDKEKRIICDRDNRPFKYSLSS